MNLRYNLIQDICNSFHITNIDTQINLGRLYKLLDMNNRYYDRLFTTKENMYLKSFILTNVGTTRISLIDKVTTMSFNQICRDLISRYCISKNIIITETEIVMQLNTIISNLDKPALIGSKYTSYIDPLETNKNKILQDLHLIRVNTTEKQIQSYFRYIEKDLYFYRGFNMDIYSNLKENYLNSHGSELAKYKLKQYVNCVMKSFEELSSIYTEDTTKSLLKQFGLSFKLNLKSPSNSTDIQKEIKKLLKVHIGQDELNKITKKFKMRCDTLGRLDYNVRIYKQLIKSLNYYDFYERSCKIFREYYKIDVIECLIVIYSIIDKGETTYEI